MTDVKRRVKVTIQIVEDGSGATRSHSADWIRLDGQESIEQAFKFAFVELISALEKERGSAAVQTSHRID